jgi:hypothetical protein
MTTYRRKSLCLDCSLKTCEFTILSSCEKISSRLEFSGIGECCAISVRAPSADSIGIANCTSGFGDDPASDTPVVLCYRLHPNPRHPDGAADDRCFREIRCRPTASSTDSSMVLTAARDTSTFAQLAELVGHSHEWVRQRLVSAPEKLYRIGRRYQVPKGTAEEFIRSIFV